VKVPEAPMETSEHGRGPAGEGWFVLNAREASWRASPSEPARFAGRQATRYREGWLP
jgi:hypothetical protein